MFKNMKFQLKLIVMLFVVGMIPLVIMGTGLLLEIRNIITSDAFNQLASIEQILVREVEKEFKEWNDSISLLSKSSNIHDLHDELENYHEIQKIKETDFFDTRSDAYRTITDPYREFFKDFINIYDYHNFFLVSAEHGHITFSTKEENDLGISLGREMHRDSPLTKVWQMVLTDRKIRFQDYSPYAPSNNDPFAFIGAPIFNREGQVEAVAVLQLSPESINNLVKDREGLGETGEVNLVGPDKLMRSNAHLDPEYHSMRASFKNPARGSIDTVASREALAGNSGNDFIRDYRDVEVLASYAPIQFGETRWAMIAKIDRSEAFSSMKTVRVVFALVILLSLAGIIGVIYFINRVVSKPLNQAIVELKTSAEELKVAAEQQATSVTEQSTAATETATAVETILRSSEQIAEAVTNVSSGVEIGNQASSDGKISLEETVEGVGEIKTKVSHITSSMLSLGEKTQQMGPVLDIINELTDQTTILSYNATIEAAGAGTAGRRFGAIAEQIGGLANKAGSSSKQIKSMIDDIQESANNTVLLTEEGTKAVDTGKKKIKNTSQHFDAVLESSETNLVIAKEVEMTVLQQLTSIEQISGAVADIQTMSSEIRVSATQTLNTADQLLEMANRLSEI